MVFNNVYISRRQRSFGANNIHWQLIEVQYIKQGISKPQVVTQLTFELNNRCKLLNRIIKIYCMLLFIFLSHKDELVYTHFRHGQNINLFVYTIVQTP